MICEREPELDFPDLPVLATCITEEGIEIQHPVDMPLFCEHGFPTVTFQDCPQCESEYQEKAA